MCEIVNQHTGNHELAINRPECGSEEYVSMKETDSVFSFLSEVPGARVSIILKKLHEQGLKNKRQSNDNGSKRNQNGGPRSKIIVKP